MKNFFKFLGIISMVLVIGFSMAGCKTDDDDNGDGDDDGGQTGGTTLAWPADFWTRDATLGKVGEWDSPDATLGRVDFSEYAGTVTTGGGGTQYELTSISGKTIKVKLIDLSTFKPTGAEITLCTGYTRTGTGETGTLTLVGASGPFANIGVLTAKLEKGGEEGGGDHNYGDIDPDDMATFQAIFTMMYTQAQTGGPTMVDYIWGASMDAMNEEYPGLNAQKTNPNTWTDAEWIRLYKVWEAAEED